MFRKFFRVYEKYMVYYVVLDQQIRVYEKIYSILCRYMKNIKRGNENVKKLAEILRYLFKIICKVGDFLKYVFFFFLFHHN